MKRNKLFILTAIASLTLVGCGDNATQVDLKTEEGAKALKTSVNAVAEAYSGSINAIGFKGELKDSSLTIAGTVSGDGFAAKNLNVGLTGLAGKLEGGVKKAASESEKPTAAFTLDASGKVGVKGDFYSGEATEPVFSLDESLTAKNVGASVYSTNDKTYVDYSGAGLRALLTDIGPIFDGVVKKITGQEPAEKTDLNKQLDDATGIAGRKILTEAKLNFEGIDFNYNYDAEVAKQIDDVIDTYVLKNESIRDVITFTTYSSGKFDIKADLTLAKVTAILNGLLASTEEESSAHSILNIVVTLLPQIVTKLDLNLALSFNKAGLLTNESLALDLELSTNAVSNYVTLLPMLVPELSFLSALKTIDVRIGLKLNETLAISYNDEVKVNLPSETELSKFVPVVVGE